MAVEKISALMNCQFIALCNRNENMEILTRESILDCFKRILSDSLHLLLAFTRHIGKLWVAMLDIFESIGKSIVAEKAFNLSKFQSTNALSKVTIDYISRTFWSFIEYSSIETLKCNDKVIDESLLRTGMY
jgi:hypothetical protein